MLFKQLAIASSAMFALQGQARLLDNDEGIPVQPGFGFNDEEETCAMKLDYFFEMVPELFQYEGIIDRESI